MTNSATPWLDYSGESENSHQRTAAAELRPPLTSSQFPCHDRLARTQLGRMATPPPLDGGGAAFSFSAVGTSSERPGGRWAQN